MYALKQWMYAAKTTIVCVKNVNICVVKMIFCGNKAKPQTMAMTIIQQSSVIRKKIDSGSADFFNNDYNETNDSNRKQLTICQALVFWYVNDGSATQRASISVITVNRRQSRR